MLAKSNVELARSQFQEDYKKILKNKYKDDYDWILYPNFDKLYLDVDIWSFDEKLNKLDDFYLHMDMSYYRSYPPGVTYVNPETKTFDKNIDIKWLPVLVGERPGTSMKYHKSWTFDNGISKQMICNSYVLEYYQSHHSPEPDQVWDSKIHNLFHTLYELQIMLIKPYYGGREIEN